MWPSESLASRIYDLANWGLIASLVLGVVSTFFIVRMGNVKETYLNAHLSDASAQAAEANERAAINEKEAQGLRARADEAELELARLTGPPYNVPVIHGVATPDLSKGFLQRVLLTSPTLINLPIMPKGASAVAWTLFLTQDARGGHTFKISWAPGWNENLIAEPGSQWTADFVTDSQGVTVERGIAGYDSNPMKNASKK